MIFTTLNNTLFIDRDGVLNVEKENGYILNWEEFVFYEGVLDAFKIFNHFFEKIILVTNQRGVAKNLMTADDLQEIHHNMKKKIESVGGRIDAIYACTDFDKNSLNRKPNIGMGLQAKKEFPNINFSKSLMIGNKLSDMQFGNSLGMKNVLITTTNPELKDHQLVDAAFENIHQFALTLL